MVSARMIILFLVLFSHLLKIKDPWKNHNMICFIYLSLETPGAIFWVCLVKENWIILFEVRYLKDQRACAISCLA